ncbi:hypothetical protein EKO04_007034 [Ascochyta lentis]|uniref:Uncharacterized protein n=1 Tax=Ascochyta lentis TaxID=205686 RepID=A0A8H7J4J2_9PLEO|nr:hypothetical protein EKO04_007034 [Ascochyta lentis]
MSTTRRAASGPHAGDARSTQQSSSTQTGREPVVLRYEKYQDTIPVRSVESEENGRQLTGVQHYLHMMSQLGLNGKPSLDHIDYRRLEGAQNTTSPTGTAEDKTSPHLPPTSSTTPTLPSPPTTLPTYKEPIYIGTSSNPALFLSILRIAQHNLPSLDFSSALNHLPNTHTSDTLPRLYPSAPGNLAPPPFLDASDTPARTNDANLHVAFLPSFYRDGRHCIGYFEMLASSRGAKKVGACLFAPCLEEELRRYGLVEYLQDREDHGVQGMRRVGAGRGYWVDKDTVEEYEEWGLVWRVVQRVWEARLGFAMGALEA